MEKTIGRVDGRKGTVRDEGLNNIQFEIVHVNGGMENNQDAHVLLRADGATWDVKYSSDSRAVDIIHLKKDGQDVPHKGWKDSYETLSFANKEKEYKAPEWVPSWMESIEPGPQGLCDVVWQAIGNAIEDICQETGQEFDSDLVNYSIEDGNVIAWEDEPEV